MISWITYSGVSRGQNNSVWWLKGGLSVVAATLAGAVTGAVLGTAGRFVGVDQRTLIVLCVAWIGLVMSLAEWLSGARLLPQRDRETHQRLLHHGPYRWALENGVLLGLGFASRLGTWLWFVIPIACVASGSPLVGAAIYGSYGLVRLGTAAALSWLAVRHTTIDVPARVFSWRRPALSAGNSIFKATCAAVLVALI